MLIDTNNPISTTDFENTVSALSIAIIYTNKQVAKKYNPCYDSRLKVLSQETTLVLSNTRELDRVPKTK